MPKSKPKTPDPEPLAKVIAAAVKLFREGKRMTQADLSSAMNEIGFGSWSKTTVSEVEGSGRGRNVTMAELFGLAHVLSVGLVHFFDQRTKASPPLELVPGGLAIESFSQLLGLIVSRDVLLAVAEPTAQAQIRREEERLQRVVAEQLHILGDEIAQVGDWIKGKADEAIFTGEDS